MAGGLHPTHAPHQILWLRHTFNERAVRILLECILVLLVSCKRYVIGLKLVFFLKILGIFFTRCETYYHMRLEFLVMADI